MKKNYTHKIGPYLFILPHFLIFLVFIVIPLLWGIYISFTKWNLFQAPEWIGFDNFKILLFEKDSTFYFQFWNGLFNTIKFVSLTVPIIIVLPFFLALLMHSNKIGWKFFMAIFYIPSLLSISAVMLTWNTMFNRTLGPINRFLGLDILWSGDQPFIWIALVIITVWWGLGINLVIYLAGINDIPSTLLDASSLDGANWFSQVRYVVIPGLKFQIIFTLVISIITQFNVFGQPLMFNKGGPSETNFVLLMYIKNLVWGSGNSIAGLGSAMAVLLGVLIVFVSIFQFKLFNREK